ncbi:hypothetical protein EG327_002545 [Venturia inaequalis]|uniref:Uncharacterized protein n=1 Tax=Venturia inaequalis TaxID=5025 RepID=A0A8H3VTR9_VENIN|nr:hypothetical protein EG327_002545 [Venturia inaequalis]
MLKNLVNRFTPNASSADLSSSGFSTARTSTQLFTKTDPDLDGEECLRDCESCTVKYPRKFDIDEDDKLYGHIQGWSRHILCATGKTDWVRDVADEKGSIMEAVGKNNDLHENGKLMLSASNIPLPTNPTVEDSTTVLLLPAFTIVDNVTPSSVPDLIKHVINSAPTNTSPLSKPPSATLSPDSLPTPPTIPATLPSGLTTRPCPHNYLILLCSQKTRDARCGQSAPLLLKEFERHLRPLGLQRDLADTRPGGVGIYFISHVGGHKYSANVMIYRRASAPKLDGIACETEAEEKRVVDLGTGEGAGQCIWLARVRPEDCENIVKYTVLQGKVLKPERQLRGGFDREKGLTSRDSDDNKPTHQLPSQHQSTEIPRKLPTHSSLPHAPSKKMPEPAQVNRSLSTVRTELEFLRDSGVLLPQQLDSIMAQLPQNGQPSQYVDSRYGGSYGQAQWQPQGPQFQQIAQAAQDPQSPANPKHAKHADWAKGMASKFGNAMMFGAGATFGGDMINDALNHI